MEFVTLCFYYLSLYVSILFLNYSSNGNPSNQCIFKNRKTRIITVTVSHTYINIKLHPHNGRSAFANFVQWRRYENRSF